MFDDQQGVPKVAQGAQQIEEAGVVGGMKSDARLIEDIENTGESTTQLGGQAGPAGFAPGKGVHSAIEGEITQAEFLQKAQAMDHSLAEGIEGVRGRAGRMREIGEKSPGGGHGKLAQGGNRVAPAGGSAEGDPQGIRVEAMAATTRASTGTEKAADAVAGGLVGGGGHATIQFREDALKRFFLPDQAALVAGLEDNGFTAGSPQEKFLGGVRPLGPGGIGFHPKVVGEVAPQGSVKGSNAGMATVPGSDGTLFQRKFRMGHYLCGIRS
jgi:hypothetical protein